MIQTLVIAMADQNQSAPKVQKVHTPETATQDRTVEIVLIHQEITATNPDQEANQLIQTNLATVNLMANQVSQRNLTIVNLITNQNLNTDLVMLSLFTVERVNLTQFQFLINQTMENRPEVRENLLHLLYLKEEKSDNKVCFRQRLNQRHCKMDSKSQEKMNSIT